MSSVAIASVVAAMCSGASEYEACSKATEAAVRQTGYYEKVEQVEGKLNQIAKEETKQIIGKGGMSAITLGAAAVRFSTGKEAKFKSGGAGISDRIDLGVSKTGGSTTFTWDF